jgi:thiamine biosynthesis lipoprotein
MKKLPITLAILSLCLSACAKQTPAESSATEFVLGTVCSIRVVQGGSAAANSAAIDAAFARLRELEAELTVNKEGSQIDAVNASAGIAPVKVGPDAIAIIRKGLGYAGLSEGAFDPSVGPLVKLWGIGTDHARLPPQAEIDAALKLVGWKDVVLDEAAGTVFLKRKGMALDLGSATKGYAADEAARILKAAGVRSAVIDLGGNVLVIGKKPDGKPWRVGLQDPDLERGNYIGIASLDDMTMVTSGVYERFFEAGGVRYHHILGTKDGYPVQNGLTSVTIITKKSFDADGVTTMLFALGREKGLALAKELGIEVIMLDAGHRVYMTPGVSKLFQITNESYKLAE